MFTNLQTTFITIRTMDSVEILEKSMRDLVQRIDNNRLGGDLETQYQLEKEWEDLRQRLIYAYRQQLN